MEVPEEDMEVQEETVPRTWLSTFEGKKNQKRKEKKRKRKIVKS